MEYEPTRRSINRHPVPGWYHDAKFGIFIHWSLSCVPAFAPRDRGDIIEIVKKEGPRVLFANQPYSEWYLNSLRIKGSPVYKHHTATYGAGYDYYDFAEEFNGRLGEWDPDAWCDLFELAGAKYVVFVTKHHDGFLLWPSRHPNPLRPALHTSRDTVGELTEAVKRRGMRMGFYYSSPYDWTFTVEPITDFADGMLNMPSEQVYLDYVDAHWRELLDRYEPSLLWSDIGYPPGPNVNELFAYFYNRTPDGVVNDRWAQVPKSARWFLKSPVGRPLVNWIGGRMFAGGHTVPPFVHHDYTTPEYTTFGDIRKHKWECVRGMGKSFGYNREEIPEDFITVPELVRLLVDIVSKNGNLLLNVGPMPGGGIPDIQADLLRGLGAWLDVCGEAVFGTRPWNRAEGRALDGTGVRFTRKDGALYAVLMGTPGGREVTIEALRIPPGSVIALLGREGELEWSQVGENLRIDLGGAVPDMPAHALRVSPEPPPP